MHEAEALRRTDLQNAQNEVERILRECRIAQEEKRMAALKLTEFQREYEQMKARVDTRNQDQESVDRELKKL